MVPIREPKTYSILLADELTLVREGLAALCEAQHIDLSGHCAPALHLSVACAAPRLRHLEWFHDHVRIERMLFDGAPTPREGEIAPDLSRPGLGLVFKERDAERYRIG